MVLFNPPKAHLCHVNWGTTIRAISLLSFGSLFFRPFWGWQRGRLVAHLGNP